MTAVRYVERTLRLELQFTSVKVAEKTNLIVFGSHVRERQSGWLENNEMQREIDCRAE